MSKQDLDRMRRVVRARTEPLPDGSRKSFREIGLELGVSKQRAGQIFNAAVTLWKERNLEQNPKPPPNCPVCDRTWPDGLYTATVTKPPEAVGA